MIKLTSTSNKPIYLDPTRIVSLQPHGFYKGASCGPRYDCTLIKMEHGHETVLETIKEVLRLKKEDV